MTLDEVVLFDCASCLVTITLSDLKEALMPFRNEDTFPATLETTGLVSTFVVPIGTSVGLLICDQSPFAPLESEILRFGLSFDE